MIAYSRIFTWDSESDTLYLHDAGWKILIGFAIVVILVAIILRVRAEV